MNDRAVSLLDQYEIEVSRTWKGRGAILCDSDQGLLILKEYCGPTDKVRFQDFLLRHLEKSGTVRAESILRTKEDELIVYDPDHVPYIVKTYFEGRECNHRDVDECRQAVCTLAKLHDAANLSAFEELHEQPVFRIEK